MGRAPCCDKANVKRGPWSPEEDRTLKSYVEKNGTGGNWIALPQKAGLKRCGKSCRLRWLNYLRPDIKHGGFTEEEDLIISTLYKALGSRWSVIASHLKGRTDNDVKNYWNTKLKKKFMAKHSSTPVDQTHISSPVSPQIPIITPESSSYEQSTSTISNSNSNSGFFVNSELNLIVSPNQSSWYSGSSAAAGVGGGGGGGFDDGLFSDLDFLFPSLDNLDWNYPFGGYRNNGDQEFSHCQQQLEICQYFT